MEVTATSRFMRMAPSKARDFARALTGKPAAVALQMTQFSRRKAAQVIGKTLKSALANAENNHELSVDHLTVKSAVIGDGPRQKRFWPRSRGMAKPILKRMCHIRVVLTDRKG